MKRVQVDPQVYLSGRLAQEFEADVIELGGTVARSISDCSHIIVSSLRRTKTVREASEAGKKVVKISWIKKCKMERCFVDEEEHVWQI